LNCTAGNAGLPIANRHVGSIQTFKRASIYRIVSVVA
jgi:hypothetical protein